MFNVCNFACKYNKCCLFCTSKNRYRGGGTNKSVEKVVNDLDINKNIIDNANGDDNIKGNANIGTNNNSNNNTNLNTNNNVNTTLIKPQTFYFKQGEVDIQSGGKKIDFLYTPNSDTNASVEELIRAAARAEAAYTMKYALVFVASAPLLMLYPFIQKYFVKGVMIGAVKE